MVFKKGQSGNPNGRPKVDNAFRDACREHAPKALETMVELMTSKDERVKGDACKWIVERGYGKAPQPVTGEDGGALVVDVNSPTQEIAKALENIALRLEPGE